MSFFANLMAGVAGSAGSAFLSEAAAAEKLQAQQALQGDRQQAMMERLMQQQMFQQALQQERSAGKTGGKSERDVFGDVLGFLDKGDTAGLERYAQAASLFSGDAGDQIRSLLSRPAQGGYGEGAPTEADVLQSMATDGTIYTPEPPPNATRGQRERVIGEQALQRLSVLLKDPAKSDDFAKAERSFTQNDLGNMALTDTLRKGGTAEDAGDVYNRVTNPAKQSATAEEYVRLKEQELALKAQQMAAGNDGKAARLSFDQIRQLQKDALEYRKLAKDSFGTQAKEYLDMARAMDEQAKQAQSVMNQPASKAPTTTTKPSASKPGSWRDAARAAGY